MKNEMYTNLLAEIRRLNAKVDEMRIHDMYEEKLMREKNEFITLNALHPETKGIVPLKVRISDISLIVDVPDAECVSEIIIKGFSTGSAIRVFYSSDEILDIIRKATEGQMMEKGGDNDGSNKM